MKTIMLLFLGLLLSFSSYADPYQCPTNPFGTSTPCALPAFPQNCKIGDTCDSYKISTLQAISVIGQTKTCDKDGRNCYTTFYLPATVKCMSGDKVVKQENVIPPYVDPSSTSTINPGYSVLLCDPLQLKNQITSIRVETYNPGNLPSYVGTPTTSKVQSFQYNIITLKTSEGTSSASMIGGDEKVFISETPKK